MNSSKFFLHKFSAVTEIAVTVLRILYSFLWVVYFQDSDVSKINTAFNIPTPPITVLNCITGVLFPPNIAYSECGNAKVKQALLDLLRGIIIQSMMYPLPPKSLPVFDIILDSCPCSPIGDSGDTNQSVSTSSGHSEALTVSKRCVAK